VPQSTATYPVHVDLKLPAGTPLSAYLAIDASYGASALGPRTLPKTDPGGRLNPRYFNPEFNLKEAWRTEASASGPVTAGDAGSQTEITLRAFDHQGALPAIGDFDPLTAQPTALRYPSDLAGADLAIPGVLAAPRAIARDQFTGDGTPTAPYTTTVAITGDQVTADPGTYLGAVAFRDQMTSHAAEIDPLPTKGYTRDNVVVDRTDFTTYQLFTLQVLSGAGNQPPAADLAATPTEVPDGGTVQLAPGPGTADPDGSITLYEYDFDYDGTFTVDATNTTGEAVTTPALENPTTAPLVRQMALRVADNGTPGLTAIDSADITINPPAPNRAPEAVLAANPTTVPQGGTTQLSPGPGTSDPDGLIVLFEYDFDYDGSTFTVDASNTTGAPVTSPALTAVGTVTMAMRVTDNGTPALTAIDAVQVTVEEVPNQAPTADLAVNPSQVAVGGTTQLSPGPGTGDPDGAIALYEYDFNYDGTFTADASNTTGAPVTSPALTSAGTITMALRVTDNGTPALTALDTATVTVEAANRPPTAEVVANPGTVPAGGTTQLSPGPGTGDPDGAIALYEFDLDYTGTFSADASNTTGAPVTSPVLSTAGTITMAMRVTDNGTPGLTALDTVAVTVEPVEPNQPPTAALEVEPTEIREGETVTLQPGAGTGDPDGAITLYEYDFNYTGIFTVDASNSTGEAVTTSALTPFGMRRMALRVTDNGGLTAEATATITILPPPGPPTWTMIHRMMALSGDPFTEGDIRCSSCHDGVIQDEPIITSDKNATYYSIMEEDEADCSEFDNRVEPFNHLRSELYWQLVQTRELCDDDIYMPAEGPRWSDIAIQMFVDWINAGALNN